MKKADYLSPETLCIRLQAEQMLCQSPGGNFEGFRGDTDFPVFPTMFDSMFDSIF